MTKTFDCNACGDKHQRPINSKFTRFVESETEDNNSVSSAGGQSDINLQILNELKNLSSSMTVMEQSGKAENSSISAAASGAGSSITASAAATDSVIRSLDFLKASDPIQIISLNLKDGVLMIFIGAKGKSPGQIKGVI